MTQTHFGYREVPEDEKSTLVRGVFDRVSSRYDLMNDLMSGGLHRLWKNEMVGWLHPRDGMRILDVAGGTGDIAFRMLKLAACHVTVCDINRQMLGEGRNRAIDRNMLSSYPLSRETGEGRGEGTFQSQKASKRPHPNPLPHSGRGNNGIIHWLCADAEALPLPDLSFDAYTIAFGIRNMTHIDRALKEAHRVLKPGGRFLCLEFSHLAQDWLQKVYDLYSFNVIPKIGEIVTGSAEPYQYLVESIRRFPNQKVFAAMMEAAGFGNVQYRSLTQGVVAIHSARRL